MKKFIGITLVFLLVLMQIPTVGLADDDTSDIMPEFSINNKDLPSGDAGKTMTLSFNLKNSGYQAKDVVIKPEFIAESNPFTVSGLTNSQTIDQIKGNSTTNIKFKLSIAPDAMAGTYPIRINIDYENAYGDSGQFSETVHVRVSSKSTPPRLIINEVSTTPEDIIPGSDTKVNLMFENRGSIEARDLSITLEGLESNKGFYVKNGSNTKHMNRIPGDSVAAVTFDLASDKDIDLGSHELSVNFSYNDSQMNPIDNTQNIYLNVGGERSNASNLVINTLEYPTSGVTPGDDFTVNFDLENAGELDATNVVVKMESTDPAIVPKTPSIIKLDSISSDEPENLNFVFTPTDDTESRNYPINITIEYEDELNQGDENKHTLTQYVGAYVDNKDDDITKGKPKLIIDKYNFEPSIVRAGEEFDMDLSFYNTNSQETVKNIKIFLTVDEKTDPDGNTSGSNVFTPVNSSNTFYIDSIAPKDRISKNITMSTVPDAEAKTYTMTANFEYENSEGEEFTATELIGVPVVQQSELELGELNVPPEAFVGQPTPIYIDFFNTGKVTLYNMMVKLEGDFQTENGSFYVGNFDTGRSEYFEGMVIPSEPGELTGELVFSYEDSAGETIETREEFTLNVMEQMPMEEFPEDMPPMEEQNSSIFKSPIFWIVIILILAIGGFVFYKKRKKKGMAIDE